MRLWWRKTRSGCSTLPFLTKIARFDFCGLRLRVNYEHTCRNYMFMIGDRWSWSAEYLYFLYCRDLHLCMIEFLGPWLESTYRLLLQSQFESALWEVAFCWSVSWAIPDSIRNHNYAWEGSWLTVAPKQKKKKGLTRVLCSCSSCLLHYSSIHYYLHQNLTQGRGAMTQAPTASKIFQSATCISSLCVLHQPYSSIIPITMACQTGSIPYVLCQFS